MTSGGGLVPAESAAELPASLLLSGPAGGVRAAAIVATACGFPGRGRVRHGRDQHRRVPRARRRPRAGAATPRRGLPDPAARRSTCTPSVPAAGRSRVSTAGGALVVGPDSAGAVPGPACYGRGGSAPTVTDADLVLGRIDPAATFPDLGRLDVAAARRVPGARRCRRRGCRRRRRRRDGAGRPAGDRRSAASTRATLALVAFGGAGALARVLPSPTRSAWPPSSSRHARARSRRSGSSARPASESSSARGRIRSTTTSPRRSPRSRDDVARRASGATPRSRRRSTVATSGRATS